MSAIWGTCESRMLGSWGWNENLELGVAADSSSVLLLASKSDIIDFELTHPVPDSRVLRYAPSYCQYSTTESLYTGHESLKDHMDCKYIKNHINICQLYKYKY